MSLLRIDDRLASLAAAAARPSVRRRLLRQPHDRRLSSCGDAAGVPTADTLELVGSAIEALATPDLDALRSVCSPRPHLRTPSLDIADLAGVSGAVLGPRGTFSDIEISIDWLVACGTDVAAEWRVRAAHTGELHIDWAVIAATGQSVAVGGMAVGHLVREPTATHGYVFDDLHVHYDTTELLVQLGLA